MKGGIPPYTYTWSCNYSVQNTLFFSASDFLDDTTSANPRIENHVPGILVFYLSVVDSIGNSCTDSVIVRFCGDFAWTLDWKFAHISQGDTVQIAPSVGAGCPPLTFQWFPEYNISDPNIATPLVWPETTTQYSSVVTDSAGCQENGGSFDVFVNPVGLDEMGGHRTVLNISPNPLTDKSTITTNIRNGKVVFFDIFGRKIHEASLGPSTEIERMDFDIGVYIYVLYKDNEMVGQGKLIVQ